MTTNRQSPRRRRQLVGGVIVAASTIVGAVFLPFLVNRLNDDPPAWVRPLTSHAGAWLVTLTIVAIVIGLAGQLVQAGRTSPPDRAVQVASPGDPGELAAADVKVQVVSEYPMVKLPDGTARIGEQHIVVFVINTGERTVTIRKWGFILPGEHVVNGTSCQLGDTELPHRLRPGDEEARFSIPASTLRWLAADEHVAPTDIRAYVQLEGDTRVLADAGVPLK